MDEATLTATLRSLALEPVLHTAPSADARLRARRLQRRRRVGTAAGAGALCLVAAAGVVALERPGDGSAPSVAASGWLHDLQDPTQPNHATTGVVTLPRPGGGQYAVYWQHDHVCLAFVTSTEPGSGGGSGCASAVPVPTQPITEANVGGEDAVTAMSVRADVAKVDVHRPDGHVDQVKPVTAAGFPYPVVVVTGRAVTFQALDGHSRRLGVAVAGPDAAQLRPVLATLTCPVTDQAGFDVVLPALNDPKSCYGLAPIAMTLTPASAQAVQDPSQGWVVQVSLDEGSRAAFGALTQRLAGLQAPRNQLAIVFEGKVFSAPSIQQAILGGSLQVSGGAKPFTEREARTLAAMLGG